MASSHRFRIHRKFALLTVSIAQRIQELDLYNGGNAKNVRINPTPPLFSSSP
jgi:hypothetical protein